MDHECNVARNVLSFAKSYLTCSVRCPGVVVRPPIICYPVNLAKDSDDAKIGRRIYEEFSMVVVLREQMRITDQGWRDFLVRLRYGKVQRCDLTMLRSLLLQHSPIDFSSPPWTSASLITPRHAVRTQWNQAALRKV